MRRAYALSLTVASALLLQTQTAFAQNHEEEDLALIYGDKITVSIATGSQQPLRRAPAVASVITAEDIAAMGATDLDEVLETVPGIHVSRNPSLYSPLWFIRGIYSQFNPQTLLLQNGVPMTTMFVGNKGNVWGGYPVENIARIEIIRGPGSALYGADAFAGVINIITKTVNEASGTQAGVRAGSFDTKRVWVQHGDKVGGLDISAYLSAGRTDGFKEIVAADAQTRNDRIFGTNASLAPGPVNVGYDSVDAHLDLAYGKWRLRSGYKLRDNLGSGAGVGSALDPVGKMKSERFNSDLSWNDNHIAPDWGAGFTLSYLYYAQLVPDYLRLFPSGVAFPTGGFPVGMIGAPETWERQVRLSLFSTYSGFANHRLRFGVGHDDLNLYKTGEYKNFTFSTGGVPIPAGSTLRYTGDQAFMAPQQRKVNYLYAQDEWQFARDWALTAGVRHDRYSDFGTTTNPRVAMVWDAALDLTAKLLYGEAFRAPAFNEQYSINNPVVRGNSALLPERIKTLETAVSWQARRDLQTNLSLFRYRMKDIIRTVPNPTPGTGATYSNTGSQRGHGLEMELVWDAYRHLRLSGNYAYQSSTDESSDQDAGYSPHHHIYARADWRFTPGWMLSPQVNWVAERKRAAGDARPPVRDYTSMDLTLRTTRGKDQWDFSVTARNVFNADIREPSIAPGSLLPEDLPMAGRAVYLQAIYRM